MAFLVFYAGLGVLLALEEAGVFFLPGDISLVAAGLHAASVGKPALLISWVVSSAGMVLGASGLFHGVSSTDTFDRVLPARVKNLIQQHGWWGVAVARLVPGLRNATVFAAASADMTYSRFLIGLIPAALVWSAALLLLGWFGGDAMLLAFGRLHHSRKLKVISFVLLLSVVAFLFWRLRSGSKKAAAGENA